MIAVASIVRLPEEMPGMVQPSTNRRARVQVLVNFIRIPVYHAQSRSNASSRRKSRLPTSSLARKHCDTQNLSISNCPDPVA